MSLFWTYFAISGPLFALVIAGYALANWRLWQREWTALANSVVFNFALPVFLFRMMSKFRDLPAVDARLLLAFFGGCLLVFLFGRALSRRVFARDGVSASVFAMGGVFSNNGLLGVPLAHLTLGEAALPSVALVLVFNALTLWTMISVSVEWSRHGSFTPSGFARTAVAVFKNPMVLAILGGTAFGAAHLQLPRPAAIAVDAIADLAAPVSLFVLGLGLAAYTLRQEWRESLALCGVKLLVQPLTVWMLAALLGVPAVERSAVVLLASLAIGVNVYLMSVQYQTMQGVVASAMVLSTFLAALTTPLFLTLVKLLG